MRGLSAAQKAPAIETVRQDCQAFDRSVVDVLSNIAKLVLWPDNTAAHLAVAANCSVRQAERFLGGQCDWSGAAIAGVFNEITRRHGMRNVRIAARQ